MVAGGVPQLVVGNDFLAMSHTQERVGGENFPSQYRRASSCVSCALLHLLQEKATGKAHTIHYAKAPRVGP